MSFRKFGASKLPKPKPTIYYFAMIVFHAIHAAFSICIVSLPIFCSRYTFKLFDNCRRIVDVLKLIGVAIYSFLLQLKFNSVQLVQLISPLLFLSLVYIVKLIALYANFNSIWG
ncbi:hypothetical protein QVD17_36175 [Tagetes erecta]|uniref:Uncharacterized protein n=1 Tax=Tagetes erecta TaxID=13708 RepID=A0AAD8JVU6_TARER|nr:hypothetical protein QVD17_36175 [Tagetes erecta]